MTEEECKCPDKGNVTMKTILQHIPESQCAEGIVQTLKDKLKDYIKYREVDMLLDKSDGYLHSTFKNCVDVRNLILNSRTSNCQLTSNTLADDLFRLYPCLYYMYFMCCSDETRDFGGVAWRMHWVKPKENDGRKAMNNWLSDKPIDEKLDKTTPNNLMKRGFLESDELMETRGLDLALTLKNLVKLYNCGGALQKALNYLLFLATKWHDGMTAHMLLFLLEFCMMKKCGCDTVIENNNDIKIEQLGLNSKKLVDSIGKVQTMLTPVAMCRINPYKNLLYSHNFKNYTGWIRKHMEDFIKSLESMKTDCKNWNRDNMFIGKTYGPLPWGFIFNGQNWENVLLNRENKSLNTENAALNLELEQKLETLIKDLKCFQIWIQCNGEAGITNPNSEVITPNMCDGPNERTGGSETEGGKARSKRGLKEESQEAAASENRSASGNTLGDSEATPETVGESSTEQSVEHNDDTEEVKVRTKREAPGPRDSDILNSADTRGDGIRLINIEGPSGTYSMPQALLLQSAVQSGSSSSSATSALISSVVATACLVGSAGYFIYSNTFGIRDKLSDIFN